MAQRCVSDRRRRNKLGLGQDLCSIQYQVDLYCMHSLFRSWVCYLRSSSGYRCLHYRSCHLWCCRSWHVRWPHDPNSRLNHHARASCVRRRSGARLGRWDCARAHNWGSIHGLVRHLALVVLHQPLCRRCLRSRLHIHASQQGRAPWSQPC